MTPRLAAKTGERAQTAAVAPTDPSRVQSAHRAIQIREFETYIGFIATLEDALLVVEATINGSLPHFIGTAGDLNLIPCRSGTVIVVAEASAKVRRWKDGVPWSPSRAFGPFLLYRQIELESSATPSHLPKSKQHSKNSETRNTHFSQNEASLSPEVMADVSYYKRSDAVDLRLGKQVHAGRLKSGLQEKDELESWLSGALARSKSSGAVRLPGIAEMLQEATPGIQNNPLLRLDNAELDQALVQELRLVKPHNLSLIRHQEQNTA
ncbi:hypothetical protein HDU78_004560 [Chytriomyces hyalinus]|nr:hypothetical protein HDU78_004560 [Chytriomyces hyalinus]